MKKKLLFQNGLALFACLFLFAGVSFAQSSQAVQITSSQQWTVPTTLNGNSITVTSVVFEAWGGGGAGGFTTGGHLDMHFAVSGAGGGGAYGKTTISNPTGVYDITIGQGGYNTADDDNSNPIHMEDGYKNHSQQHGGTTTVAKDGTPVLEAQGGQTCWGIDNTAGAAGGAATGAGDLHYAGGRGGNAAIDCGGWYGRRSTGGGGGAAGPNGNGGDGGDAECLANTGWGHGGTAGGGLAGDGGDGTSDHNDVLGGKPVGLPGLNYGGGGAGSKTYLAWHSGGAGAPGAVLITYTYVINTVQSVEIADASATICSGADFDVTLNITADGFNLSNATVIPNSTSNPSLSVSAGTSFNTTDGKWHLTGSATNTTSNTVEFPITVTVTTPDGSASDNATITLNVYGKLNGGVIAADQFVCQDQTIQMIKGNGDVVYSASYGVNITTAPATGGSGDGDYQWLKEDVLAGDADYQPISGTNSPNYTPSTGYAHYQRTYTDNVCGTTVTATDGMGSTYVILVSVNPFNPGNLSGTDNICSDEAFTKTLEITEFTSPASSNSYYTSWNVYWQKSTDNGATWNTVASSSLLSYTEALAYTYTINVSAGELTPGEIQYRYALEAYKYNTTCTMVPCNGVYKLIVGSTSTVDYTEQFTDKEITLYYGECERDITDLAAPDLNPVPASIERGTDGITTVTPGEYNITWIVVPEGSCGDPQEYTQKVIVKFPKCGTLEEPYVVTDRYGYEYNTIRIGCDCWLAENLRTNATNATYYDNDDANEAFGRLYDWNDAVGSFDTEMETKLGTTYIQGVCPMGWAIPTVEQFNTMMSVAGEAEDIKSDDANAWLPDLVGTNTSGFAAMGAGFYAGMEYQRLLGYTDFWTADLNESNTTVAKAMELRVGCDDLLTVDKNKADKLSVRCVKVEPADYVNINIAFDMHDQPYADGWSGGYILATYGTSSVVMTVTAEENICTLPVPRGSDVTLEWIAGDMSSEASYTITNEETGDVIAQGNGTPSNAELAQFHVDGASNPADFQTVDFDFSVILGSWGETGLLEVDYGTGKLNLGSSSDDDMHSTVAFPAGTHIKLSWIDPNDNDSWVSFTVKYTGAGDYLLEIDEPEAGLLLEFDVVKQ